MSLEKCGVLFIARLLAVVALCFFSASAGFAQSAADKKAEEFMAALKDGNMAKAQRLLANVNPNHKLGGTVPLLVVAASTGQPTIVKMLLDKGADVNATDPDGETALMSAVTSGNLEVVTMLIDKGANVQAKDKKGVTALKMLDRYLKIRELLLTHGAAK
jgi:uncharacterized protein